MYFWLDSWKTNQGARSKEELEYLQTYVPVHVESKVCTVLQYITINASLLAHDCCIRGVAIDSLNQQILTAGADGKLKVRDLYC